MGRGPVRLRGRASTGPPAAVLPSRPEGRSFYARTHPRRPRNGGLTQGLGAFREWDPARFPIEGAPSARPTRSGGRRVAESVRGSPSPYRASGAVQLILMEVRVAFSPEDAAFTSALAVDFPADTVDAALNSRRTTTS
jgi:hypothetical protein